MRAEQTDGFMPDSEGDTEMRRRHVFRKILESPLFWSALLQATATIVVALIGKMRL